MSVARALRRAELSRPRYDWWGYEVWKDIQGYNGRYQVSNYGRVKSFVKNSGGITLKAQKKKTGYLCVNLYKNNQMRTLLIHRLVAEAFFDGIEFSNLQVNHKNEDKTNNCVWNLELLTARANANYGTRNQRVVAHSDRKAAAKNLRKPVVQLSPSGEPMQTFESVREAARVLKLNSGQISSCCLGNKVTAGGHQWRYLYEQN